MFNDKPVYSIILPVCNEEKNLEELYSRLKQVLDNLKQRYEIIFVNDGSTDDSYGALLKLREKDQGVKLIDFSRNFGHQIAISAGLDFASGQAVIMMDSDLQHPPELIPQLIDKWKEGNEIVYTVRQATLGIGALKQLTSKLFYVLMNKFSGLDLEFGSADFRLLDRKVADYFKQCRERVRFIRGLTSWLGFKKVGIKYQADKRLTGKTKYSFLKMFKFAADGVVSFSSGLLHFSTVMGIIISLVSFVYALYAVYIRLFTDKAVAGWTSILIAVLFLGGVQLISIGIIGEYLSRVYDEVKARPLYVIKQLKGFEK